jgi:hypothetical protein
MENQRELILPDSFEDMKSELGKDIYKMMEFFVPVTESETTISFVASSIRSSGKLLLMHGIPGVGKSTFIQSLKWRTHIRIREIYNIDTTKYDLSVSKLPQLLREITEIIKKVDISPNQNGVISIVIDYLEHLADETPETIRSFFRTLNGIMRQSPVLIIWPMTEIKDIDTIIEYSNSVSKTLFVHGCEVLHFTGPDKQKYPQILKNTISVLNTGFTFDDFGLVDEDFDVILKELDNRLSEFTLRDYMISIRQVWSKRTGQIQQILNDYPKQTEIWFIFSMPEAEEVVSQFVRKSTYSVEDSWDAYHAKLNEYIHDNQRAAFWDPNRLQIAISGSFKAKILFLTTHSLVSTIAAYSRENGISVNIDWEKEGIPTNWLKKSKAKSFLEKSALIKQLTGEKVQLGKTRGGPVRESINTARTAFEKINAITSNQNLLLKGSDKPFNKILSSAIGDIVPQFKVTPEKEHPWIKNIYPDIMIEQDTKLICLEFCYTKKSTPHVVADYVLNKLDNYMRQLELIYPHLKR